MAPQLQPDIMLNAFQRAIHPLNNWYSVLVFGILGTISSVIMTYHGLDSMRDRFQAEFYDTEDTFDFIVVGAGSAGAVVANRLSENYKVLVLESGGEPNPLTNIPALALLVLNYPHIDWRFFTQPQPEACLGMNNGGCFWPRGKALGGSSNLNFLIYMRGHPEDFKQWARITGDPRWGYESVLEFFKKSEDYVGQWDDPKYHGHGGLLSVTKAPYQGLAEYWIKAAKEHGYNATDLNARYTEGFSPIYYTQKHGRRYGTYRAFLEPARSRKNLFIYKYSDVQKVLFRGKSPDLEAYGVEYVRHGVRKRAFAKKEVIVSAGTVMSPHLLMHSGIGPRKQLEENQIKVLVDSPGVGENLQDHISGFVGPFILDSPRTMLFDRDINAQSVMEFVQSGTGALSSTGTQASAFLVSSYAKATKNESHWPDIQWILLGTGIYARMDDDFAHSFNFPKETMRKWMGDHKGKDAFFVINMLSRPKSRGKIVLGGPDPSAYPLIHAGYLKHPDDVKVLIEGAKRTTDLVMNSKTFKDMDIKLPPTHFPGCEQHAFGSDIYWECFHRHCSLTVYHHVGTCAMGKKDDKNAVVDSELKVFGTKNLRVIDASVMPIISNGNTNAPTIMIGEMGSNFIKEAWATTKSNEIIR
ncbi:glucose dehydrogenase [FAD, quinone] [Folsomia candida]|uniref:glucose dehydrogenase [FAD, quinone] n=1 Tax=Folsomia candida TaxID=158441 RepID=UPI000B906237|nr:glucose dehydrogenase [FAD, quinone] [Folsomia candida]